MVSFFMLLIIAMGAFWYEKLPRNEDPAFTIKTAVVSRAMARGTRNGYHPTADRYAGKKLQETPGLIISKVNPVPENRYLCQSS